MTLNHLRHFLYSCPLSVKAVIYILQMFSPPLYWSMHLLSGICIQLVILQFNTDLPDRFVAAIGMPLRSVGLSH